MNENPARLLVRYGSLPEETYRLTHDTTNLGREPFNDIVLNFPEISRRHARILVRDGVYVLEDLNSTNGTMLNGRSVIDPVELEDGDEIDLAEAVGLTFQGQESAATVPLPAYRPEEAPTMGRRRLSAVPDFDDEDQEAVTAAPLGYDEAWDEPRVIEGEEDEGRGCGRYFLGCFLIVLILAIACGATIFFIDSYNPDLLYCGPMEPVVSFIADVLTLLGFGPVQPIPCPVG